MKDQSVTPGFQKGRAPPGNEKPAGVGSAHGSTRNCKYDAGSIAQFQAKSKPPHRGDMVEYLEKTIAKIRLYARVLMDRSISDLAKLTCGVLLFDFHNTENDRCDPAAKTIGERLDRDERTIRRGLKELSRCGVVVMRRRKTSPEYKFPDLEIQDWTNSPGRDAEDRTKSSGLDTRERTKMPGRETPDWTKSSVPDIETDQDRTRSPDKPLPLRIINTPSEGESTREEADPAISAIHAAPPLTFEESSPSTLPVINSLVAAKASQIEIIPPNGLTELERRYAQSVGLTEVEIERETAKLIAHRAAIKKPGYPAVTWFDRAAEWKKRNPDRPQTARSATLAAQRLVEKIARGEALGLDSAGSPQLSITLNKDAQSKLWRKVEELRGRSAPTDRNGNWTFPQSLVDRARRELGDGG
jgi:hypothetical protein